MASSPTTVPFRSTKDVQNNNLLDNYGGVEIAAENFNNNAGATVQNRSGATFSANLEFLNNGTIVNDGEFTMAVANNFVHNSVFTNNGIVNDEGTLTNNSTFDNNNTFNITESGVLDNQSTFQNDGTITIAICGRLLQKC